MKPISVAQSGGLFTHFGALVFIILAVIGTESAHATTRGWTGNSNNKWSNPNNWVPVGVPQDGEDLLLFGGDNSDMVNDLSGLVANSLNFGNSDTSIDGSTIFINSHPSTQFPYAINNQNDERHVVTISCGIVLQSDATFITGFTQPDALDRLGSTDLHLNGPIDLAGHNLTCRSTTAVYPFGGGDYDYGPGNMYFDGVISGSGNVSVYSEVMSYTEFSGSSGNLFRGTLTIGADQNGGVLLEVGSGVVTTDALLVKGRGYMRLGKSDQIGDNATVTVQQGATFTLNNFNDTISTLVLNSAASDPAPANFDTGTGTLVVQSNITCINLFSNASLITGNINLPPGTHIISSSSIFGSLQAGLDIEAQINGSGGFNKIGADPLFLDRANNFDGNVLVADGILYVRNPNALGSAVGTTTLSNSVIDLSNLTVTNETMIVQSGTIVGEGNFGWAGPINVPGNLYVHNDGPATFSGPISGSGYITYNGDARVLITGPSTNTFNGGSFVWGALVEFDKPSSVRAFSGTITVGTDGTSPYDRPVCEARWINNYQGLGANVYVYGTGIVNINNFVEDFTSLQMTAGLVETGTGQLEVDQSLISNPTNVPATINGYIYLSPVTSTITVANGTADPDLQINAIISGASTRLIKQGPGTLALSANNAYIGDTLVSQGILEIENAFAFGIGSQTVTVSNATVSFNGSGTISRPFLISGTGATNASGVLDFLSNSSFTLSGGITLAAASTVNVGLSGGAALTGVISGTGPLTKVGPGTLALGGTSANTFSGNTIISAGLVNLTKSTFVAAVPNQLVIGPSAATTVVTFFGSAEVGGATITVNQNGVLDLNGYSETLSTLNLNDGGRVQMEAGGLNFFSGGLVSVGSLSLLGSQIGSSISGTIGLPGNADLTFNVSAYRPALFPPPTAPELDVSAFIPKPIENGGFAPAGIAKNGFGTMRLTANNGYRGENDINGGTLEVDGSQPGSPVFISSGTLSGTGVVSSVYPSAGSAVVAPGHNGPGILVCSNFNASASGPGVLQVELNGVTPGTSYDQLDCKGTVNLTGISLNASLNFASNLGNHFTIINNESPSAVTGTFSGLPEGASFYLGGERFSISYVGGTGNDVVLTRLATPPKPTLAIEKVAPTSVRLLWGTNFTGWTLQSISNLNSGTWSNVSPAPVISGVNYVVTNTATSSRKSYRLIQ